MRPSASARVQEKYRGSNLVVEPRPNPHSSKSLQIWRGPFPFLLRRNWRQALTRAAQNSSAAQLAYCVVAFSERMQAPLATLERQHKKAAKQRAEEARGAQPARPSRAKRPRLVRRSSPQSLVPRCARSPGGGSIECPREVPF